MSSSYANPGADLRPLHLASFTLASHNLALPILSLYEINRVLPTTLIPQSPSFIAGIADLRGRPIPIVNLYDRLGLPTPPRTPSSRMIIIELAHRLLGFVVDQVNHVLRIDPAALTPPSPANCQLSANCIQSVATLSGESLLLLDPQSLFSESELAAIDMAAAHAAQAA